MAQVQGRRRIMVNLGSAARPGTDAYTRLSQRLQAATIRIPGANSREGARMREEYGAPRVRSLRYIPQNLEARALVRRRTNDGNDRYFHVPINIRGGAGVADFVDQLNDRIQVGRDVVRAAIDANRRPNLGSHWYEDDDDNANYELVRLTDISYSGRVRRPRARADFERGFRQVSVIDEADGDDIADLDDLDENFSIDDEDLYAQHQYQQIPLEQFAMRPLIMRDFTCIYESFMIIKWFHENNDQPPMIYLHDWRLYVLLHFNSEPFQIQQMFYQSYVQPCLEYFIQKYQIQVVIFNAVRFEQEFESLRQLEALGNEFKYFIVYWGEHVFPCVRSQIETICEFQRQFIKKYERHGELTNGELMFVLVPPVFNYLNLEVKCSLFPDVMHGGRLCDGDYLHTGHRGFSLRDILKVGPMLRGNVYSLQKQQIVLTAREQAMLKSDEELKGEMFNYLRRKKNNYVEKMMGKLQVLQQCESQIYFRKDEYDYYKVLMQYRQENVGPHLSEEDIKIFDEALSERSRLIKYATHRKRQFLKKGLAVIDIETYVCNRPDRQTFYNMIPFCVSLVGNLQQMVTYYKVDSQGRTRRKHKTVLVENISEYFIGFQPKECIRKLIRYLIDNNYCYINADHNDLNTEGTAKNKKQKRLMNYIFAHNGFGFDYKFMYEELHSCMREFKMVGDICQTKSMQGNGLYFYDFSLIYREKLSVLAKTFFPNKPEWWKYECELIKSLPEDTLAGWYAEARVAGYKESQHPRVAEIIKYCVQDSYVLLQIVKEFFLRAYTTPFGYGFLPKPFYHSISQMAYSMFTTCYLKKPIFVNKEALQIELDTKSGGCTGCNSNIFGVGVFIDENSFYPSVMCNEMPVEYKIPVGNPYEYFEQPIDLTFENFREYVQDIDICRITFSFPPDTVLPVISQKSRDTMVMVLESDDFDICTDHNNANATYVYGYVIRVAFEEIPGTRVRLFGKISYKRGDFIFREFITDQYNARLECKAKKDKVGDQFHKQVMNSSQGKLGQKLYRNVKFGGVQHVRDVVSYLHMRDDVEKVDVKQILSDNVDLYEIRWESCNDRWLSQGNTVRIPAYIMAVSRAQLMRIQNAIAKEFGNPDVIAYYDTDSILSRFDLLNPQVNMAIQLCFDDWQHVDNSLAELAKENIIVKVLKWKLKNYVTQLIAKTILDMPETKRLYEMKIQDVTKLHDPNAIEPLLDENRLGACKVEKLVIRGVALGAKQYGAYYLEYNGDFKRWDMKVAVKLKGVRPEARDMGILEDISGKLCQNVGLLGDIETRKLPFAVTKIMDKWSRMGAGTIISQMVKIVRPTLTKRRHDVQAGTSIPFRNLREFQQHKDQYEQVAMLQKAQFRDSIDDLIDQIHNSESYKALVSATKSHNQLQRETSLYFKQAAEALAETRKRYLLRVQKLKYNQLQDYIMDGFLNRLDICELASLYLSKLEAIAYQAVLNKRKNTHKGCYDFKNLKGQMTTQQAARTIAYMLFIYYVINNSNPALVDMEIPKNFVIVCRHIQVHFIDYLILGKENQQNQEKEEWKQLFKGCKTKTAHKWNYSLVYAFEFLQAGVCVFKNYEDYMTNRDCTLFKMDEFDSRKVKYEYTNLWRFLNNLQNRFQKVKAMSEVLDENGHTVIDTRIAEDSSIQVPPHIDRKALRGKYRFLQPLMFDINEGNEVQARGSQDDENLKSSGGFDLVNMIDDNNELLQQMSVRGKKRPQRFEDEEEEDKHEALMMDEGVKDHIRKRPRIINDDPAYEHDKTYEGRIAKLLLMGTSLVEVNDNLNQSQLSTEDLSYSDIYRILREEFNMVEFDQQFLQSLFCFANNATGNKAQREDMLDITLLYLYLYSGGLRAALIMKKLCEDIKKFYSDTKQKNRLFVRVCRILFCRSDMFQAFIQKGKMSKKTTELIRQLQYLTVDFTGDEHTVTEEQYQQQLIQVVTDQQTISPKLYQLFTVIRSNQQLQEIGKYIFHKILLWRNPSDRMLNVLKCILTMQQDHVQEVRNDDAQVSNMIQAELDRFQEQIELPFFNKFLQREDLFSEQDFDQLSLPSFMNAPPVQQQSALQRAIQQVEDSERLDNENSYDHFFRTITARVRQSDLDPADEVDSNFGIDQPPTPVNRFIEQEAEEGESEEESLGSFGIASDRMMICTNTIHRNRCCPLARS